MVQSQRPNCCEIMGAWIFALHKLSICIIPVILWRSPLSQPVYHPKACRSVLPQGCPARASSAFLPPIRPRSFLLASEWAQKSMKEGISANICTACRPASGSVGLRACGLLSVLRGWLCDGQGMCTEAKLSFPSHRNSDSLRFWASG